ncbi:hypothetical protein GY45DRAFT_719890 [Cubamyces sp. BRFM 1775]|nr:hypothetical protein GY45DRAFT_719890 [Cubamyces sp. BRFM 1775]
MKDQMILSSMLLTTVDAATLCIGCRPASGYRTPKYQVAIIAVRSQQRRNRNLARPTTYPTAAMMNAGYDNADKFGLYGSDVRERCVSAATDICAGDISGVYGTSVTRRNTTCTPRWNV